MRDFLVLEKAIGQTPLEVLEAYKHAHPEYQKVPMAYAGRLDPMASGLLLVLVGDTCKVQERYHNLDKEYQFEILFGVASDTGDVLGLVKTSPLYNVTAEQLLTAAHDLIGPVSLPYPHFSSKTVRGKPLHTWTLEGRLNEIEIPTKESVIYKLSLKNLRTITKEALITSVIAKVNTIKPVTDERKALGADFRRVDVRASWYALDETTEAHTFYIATFTCSASSGTYMRTLAEVIARKLGTTGLAYSIHRTKIGKYQTLPLRLGFWRKLYTPDNS